MAERNSNSLSSFKLCMIGLVSFFCFCTELHAACYCLCSAFKTSGGERKICATEPTPIKEGVCKNWLQLIPDVNDEASCQALGEDNHDCQGYFKDARNGDRWAEVYDGRYHTCHIR